MNMLFDSDVDSNDNISDSNQGVYQPYLSYLKDRGDAGRGLKDRDITRYEQAWIRKVEEVLTREAGSAHYGISELSDELACSRRQVQRRIKKITGLSPIQYARHIKLSVARTLLESGRFSTVSEVCYRVGFSSPHYFTTLFFDRYKRRPSEFFRCDADVQILS